MNFKGESDDPDCIRAHHGDEQQLHPLSNHDQRLKFALKFGECNMRRQRTLNPRGVAYTFTVVVSFHPIFETEVDRAYQVRCFFTESVKALGASLAVRCVLDPLLLSDVEYDDQAITAYAQTRVFKYSDKIQLYFTCTVQLCVKNDGGCDDVTPPICENVKYLTQLPIKYSSPERGHHDDPSHLHQRKSEKEFFGPIDAEQKEISTNSHFTPSPSSQQSSLVTETTTSSNKVRARRGIHRNNSLKQSEMNVAEMDVTARVVVLPLIEVHLSNVSPGNSTARDDEEAQAIPICLSSLDMLLLFGTVIFLVGASCLLTVLFIKHKQVFIISFKDSNGVLERRPVDCSFDNLDLVGKDNTVDDDNEKALTRSRRTVDASQDESRNFPDSTILEFLVQLILSIM
ncbi:unnamed protein product [Litomosoides sigmodontis]|uniref:ZP domain-containing protein n=1 Tax=Litomosoides sigmodontis TaxID=42156 RepID=A0A3P6U3L2_LITSI|nr:unnamed protein product [Litomosoides sigmodontis]